MSGIPVPLTAHVSSLHINLCKIFTNPAVLHVILSHVPVLLQAHHIHWQLVVVRNVHIFSSEVVVRSLKLAACVDLHAVLDAVSVQRINARQSEMS